MKRPVDVVADIGRRLSRTWSQTLAGEDETAVWPHQFPLSGGTSRALGEDFASIIGIVDDWRTWSRERTVELLSRERRVNGVLHSIPSHVVIPSIEDAVRVCGRDWTERLERGRSRLAELDQRFPGLTERAALLRAVDGFEEADFQLLLRAGAWFANNSAQGLTPRQVPLEGFHAKWLNTRQHLVAKLAGREDLGLAPNHPSRIHFSYLDPEHLASGGRRHDSATVGDVFHPAYAPEIVIISENKDTAINFPALGRAISVEGVGRGGKTLASFEWIVGAPLVIYWGDMDADGLEILDGFRADGVPARSIFMDRTAFERWERFGTNTDKRGVALGGKEPRPVPQLSDEERDLYLDLVSESWTRARRVEQERIPLEVARDEVTRVCRTSVAVPQ